VIAEHADVWNFPGGSLEDALARGVLLDRYCAEIGRDPAAITRSLPMGVSYDDPGATRDAASRAIAAGFRHFVLSLPAPYPPGVARWVAEEIISPLVLPAPPEGAGGGRY
jgi:alkanesulfonate monooxygenase SsuD/methylene tetrahydromethanopterin reductase-like flavin-dependent oxidoreductase (luciferase family)